MTIESAAKWIVRFVALLAVLLFGTFIYVVFTDVPAPTTRHELRD